jgi:HlyD family secretion protein
MSRSIWIGVAVLATVCGSVTVWGLQTTSEIHVTTTAITTGAIQRRVAATGTLQPVTTVEVGVQVSGIVQSLLVDFNSIVHAGDVLARLDPSDYEAQRRQVEALLKEAQAAAQKAEADLQGFRTARDDANTKLTRAEALAAKDLIPKSDLDAARIAMDEAKADMVSGEAGVVQANASVAQAQAALDQATVNLEHTVIRSPIEGIVVDRSVDVGQTLAASVQAPVLFRIAADLTHMQVQVNVDEADVGGMTAGDRVSFEVESYPRQTFYGTLSQVRLQPVAQLTTTATTLPTSTAPGVATQIATVVSYTAIVDVANDDERLRPGMTAEVALPGARRDRAVRIPNTALSFRPPAEGLRTPDESQTAESGPGPGARADQKSVEVWTYDGKRFSAVHVVPGLADDRWTELVSGPLHHGDELVTAATVEKHRKL